MKHNTHIYIARKAMEFLYDSLAKVKTPSGNNVSSNKKKALRRQAKVLQRLLFYHRDHVTEASWAPDDILKDMAHYHTFKLFTDGEFGDAANFAKQTFTDNGDNYYRASGSGGLPFKVDHLGKIIANLIKLRDHNDSYSMQQLMYLLLLISHYVADANVPMHCDIRDDKPSDKKPAEGNYYSTKWHGKIESLWDKAATPVGLREGLIDIQRAQDNTELTDYSDSITFDVDNSADVKKIKTYAVPRNKLMDFMVELCIKTKKRSLVLFPPENPDPDNNEDYEAKLRELTPKIFADAIGSVISIWMCIWAE
ncbi:MAG: hypothetical protein V3V99_15190 [candidate division Zixibacteria bacterium]